MRVSIIIAVYNTQQYLRECLDSLLRQTHRDWEAWCVDDGSTDNSWEILQQYARNDHRFNIIHLQKNQGQAKARNLAIKQCDGDLVAFLDSDDWYGDDGLEEIVNTFTKYPETDCVLWRCMHVTNGEEKEYQMPEFQILSGKEAFCKSLDWTIHGVYVTRASIHKKHLFDESAKWYSDDNTTRRHYYESREVRTCKAIYYYRTNPNSVTHAVNIHHFDILDANDSMRKQLSEMHVDKDLKIKYEDIRWRNIIGCYFYYYMHRGFFSKEERKQIKDKIRKSWEETDLSLLPRKVTRLPGHAHLCSWRLFLLQEELYFMLRGIVGKNKI